MELPAAVLPPEIPLKPLAEARKRLEAALKPPVLPPPTIPKPRGARPAPISPDLVIGMTAAGIPTAKIADALHVNRHTIKKALARQPDARERIAELRESLKGIKMEKAHRIEGKMWKRLEQEVDGGDAKSVDAMARALLASEKIQAAASGEAHASGPAPTLPTNIDLKLMINTLLGTT